MEQLELTFRANNQCLEATNFTPPLFVASNTVDWIVAKFDLGTNWDCWDLGAVKAIWKFKGQQYSAILNAEGECTVPHEVLGAMTGEVKVNLVASTIEDDVVVERLTTYPLYCINVNKVALIDGDNSVAITPSEYEQFVEDVQEYAQDAYDAKIGAEQARDSALGSAGIASDMADTATQAKNYAVQQAQLAADAKEAAQTAQGLAEQAKDSAISAKEDAESAKQAIENMSATASVGTNTGTPSVVVTKSTVEGHENLDFDFDGLKGATGATGNGIESIAKTGTSGLVDTYTITFTNGQTTTFEVRNGEDGSVAPSAIASDYSSSSTYAVGDYVWYDGDLYRCTTAITTAEAWTSGHWAEVALADEVSDLKSNLEILNSYVVEEKLTDLPNTIKGNFEITKNADDDIVISGTHNVAQLLNIAEGIFTINGVTFTVNGNTISVSGKATANFSYSVADGIEKTSTELSQMTLPLPEHLYTLSTKAISGSTPYSGLLVRSKSSGNVVVSQNNSAQFTMDKATCGGLYMYMSNGTTYNFTYKIALFPYSTTSGNPYREQTSEITVYDSDGIYAIDGYTWTFGNPTVIELTSKLSKKPMCKYSTRTINYSSMTECLDVYIPAKTGYVNYIFGHTETAIPISEGGGDVWRLVQVDAVNDALAYQFHITQFGETEMAIMINGRSDFIGGTTHGDEAMDAESLLFVIDGKPTDITTITELTEFNTLQCFLVSDMYDPADHTTLVGKHGREWKFDKNGLYIGQTVEFTEDLTLGNSYMPMLCVLRGNDTASTLQVTDTYTDDGNYQKYDVSVGGFTTYPNKLKSDVREINLFGEVSGVRASLQIIEQPEGLNKEGTFLYNGVNTYNKIYCCLCGYGGGANTQNVSSGDKWKVKSQITIDVGN